MLGAGHGRIILSLSAEFTRLMLLAVLIGLPLSYFLAEWWLQDFAFRIQLGLGLFAGVAALAFLVAWATVGWQTLKAARINPIRALKEE